MISLIVNGHAQSLDVPDDMPLLWVLRDLLGLTGTKYGCGVGACGACTVHVDGEATLACLTPVRDVANHKITTIEGLGEGSLHPVQQAWIDEQVPQCGYCQPGQIMRASALLARNKTPTRAEIIDEMRLNLCRCGTYLRIIQAIERAAGATKTPT